MVVEKNFEYRNVFLTTTISCFTTMLPGKLVDGLKNIDGDMSMGISLAEFEI